MCVPLSYCQRRNVNIRKKGFQIVLMAEFFCFWNPRSGASAPKASNVTSAVLQSADPCCLPGPPVDVEASGGPRGVQSSFR